VHAKDRNKTERSIGSKDPFALTKKLRDMWEKCWRIYAKCAKIHRSIRVNGSRVNTSTRNTVAWQRLALFFYVLRFISIP